MHEPVEAAQPFDPLGTGPQHQVIGVGEDDLGAGQPDRLGRHRLDRGGGADRHERRGADLAPAGGEPAGPGGAVPGGNREGKASGHPVSGYSRQASP